MDFDGLKVSFLVKNIRNNNNKLIMPECTLNTTLNQNMDRHLETYQETQAINTQGPRAKQEIKSNIYSRRHVSAPSPF